MAQANFWRVSEDSKEGSCSASALRKARSSVAEKDKEIKKYYFHLIHLIMRGNQ